MPTWIRPPRLKRGDVARLISLSGTFPKSSWQFARSLTDALGLKLEIGKSLWQDPGYIGRDPKKRAADFNSAVASDRVRAILLFRGGNSAAETLPFLDLAALRRRPKVVAGFSDHSSIVSAVAARAGVVSFLVPPTLSGDPPGPGRHDLTVDTFRALAMDGVRSLALPAAGAQTWRAGRARGVLVGGNLMVLRNLLGTPWFPPTDRAILAWEEVGESIQDINMALTSLRNAGVLARLAGMLVGHLEDVPPKEDGYAVRDFVLEKMARGPVMKTSAFGHFRPCFTLPIGVRATLDAGRKRFTIDEPAVR